jgi:hypothetical protein
VKSAEVRVEGQSPRLSSEPIRKPLVLESDPARFSYTVVPLPAGEFRSLSLHVEPADASARLNLHRWCVISVSADAAEAAK